MRAYARDMTDQAINATSFGAETEKYERGRPEYPREAVAWMLEPLPSGPVRIVDLGAGTGKLTRALLDVRDAEIVAVDPDPKMLAVLHRSLPEVPSCPGTAESLPLADSCADAVVMGQAWHWVDQIRACTQIGRALRPGGVLGTIWNIRDDRVDWVHRLTEIMNSSPAEKFIASDGPDFVAPFKSREEAHWEWRRPMTRPELHDMVLSRSYLITGPAEERRRVIATMDALLADLGVGDDTTTIDMPYVTAAYRTVRPARRAAT